MNQNYSRSSSVLVWTILVCASALVTPTAAAETSSSFGNTPLSFEPNQGQWTKEASFGTHAQGFSALFHGPDVVYSLQADERQARIATRWIGAAKKQLNAVDKLPGTANYYVGNDESRWISGLPTYRRSKATAIYPGVDLVYYGHGQQLEYDLVVAPGTDTSRVMLAFEGGRSTLDEHGNLILTTNAGQFIQHRPVAYQPAAGGERTPVDAKYMIGKRGEVTLALGKYDRRRELVIDPTIAWARTLGSGTADGSGQANAVAVDSSGNVFVGGITGATDFPAINAYQSTLGSSNCCNSADAFVTKFNPDGSTVIFSTYFGGSNTESGTGLAVDGSGNAILVGYTTSADMGTKNAYQNALRGMRNAFIAKFSPTGALIFATYLGGSAYDGATAVAVDSTGAICLTGTTTSTDFPILVPYQGTYKGGTDGFLTKLRQTARPFRPRPTWAAPILTSPMRSQPEQETS